jgi:spore maturation protein SpmA
MINIIWGGMFLVAVCVALFKLAIMGDIDCFNQIVQAIFNSASSAVDISIGLIGILSFWLGILKLIEKTGITEKISHKLAPLFSIIMKDIPQNSPAISTVVLNMAANFLGLDNAATPMGLKAMEQLQEYNKQKDSASDAQILFMILNASSVTLIPITIFMYRAKLGASYPTDVFIPILLATSVSTLIGFLLVAIKQKISLQNPILLKWIILFVLTIAGLSALFLLIPTDKRLIISSGIGNFILVILLGYIIFKALRNKLSSYEIFIDGAKEGFNVAINILPYLVSMLVAIAVFRACGILDIIANNLKLACSSFGIDNSFIDALPVALMKPLSGSGARAMMIETMQNFGADSFASFVASVVQGSTETTFYVLTVYFGAVRISKIRYALKYALLSDLAGIIAAILFSYMFYNM